MESSNTNIEMQNNIQVLIDTQFRPLTKTLKDSLDNSLGKRNPLAIKQKDYIVFKAEDIKRDNQEPGTSSSNPNEKRRVGPVKLPSNTNEKRMTSQDDDPLSLFPPSAVEDELQGDEGDTLRGVMFVLSETEPQPEEQTGFSIANGDILCELTVEFKNDKLCDPKINPNQLMQ